MAYNENTPADINEKFSTSQPKITANFISIKTAFDVNHETFDTPGDHQGKHKFVTIREQLAKPALDPNEMALYTKEIGGISALFIEKEDGTEIDITTSANANPGYCVLPCGLRMAWGTSTIAVNSYATIGYHASAGITTILSGSATLNGESGMNSGFYIKTLGTASITVYNGNANGGNRTFYYYVIGV